MPIEVRLPQLADQMTAAKVGAWLKREGDAVVAGEPIVEVETDKTNVEIEAPASGILQKILIPAGSEGVLVDALLATIAEANDRAAATAPAPAPRPEPAPAALPEPIARPMPMPAAAATAPVAATTVAAPAPAAAPQPEVNATPVAKKIARLAGIDLASIAAADGVRVTKTDVEVALGKRPVPPTPETRQGGRMSRTGAPAPSQSPYEDQPLSTMRRVTATRLQEAKQSVPHFYLEADCRVDALLDLRAQWNARGTVKVTVTDLLVFAASRALRKVPLANSAWVETAVRVFEQADIAVAVSTAKGLITPIVRGAERKSILAISRELNALAERARKGALKPDEYSGGTFTISNLGMYGITRITPILNTPQACILGVGAVEARPVISAAGIVPGRMMSCTLAADHRAIDGATGAEFMAELRRLIEDPLSMTLEA